MSDRNEKEVTTQISIVTGAILIAFCSLLFKCTYSSNQYALNYHKAVEVCKGDTLCIKCYTVATNFSEGIKSCVGTK